MGVLEDLGCTYEAIDVLKEFAFQVYGKTDKQQPQIVHAIKSYPFVVDASFDRTHTGLGCDKISSTQNYAELQSLIMTGSRYQQLRTVYKMVQDLNSPKQTWFRGSLVQYFKDHPNIGHYYPALLEPPQLAREPLGPPKTYKTLSWVSDKLSSFFKFHHEQINDVLVQTDRRGKRPMAESGEQDRFARDLQDSVQPVIDKYRISHALVSDKINHWRLQKQLFKMMRNAMAGFTDQIHLIKVKSGRCILHSCGDTLYVSGPTNNPDLDFNIDITYAKPTIDALLAVREKNGWSDAYLFINKAYHDWTRKPHPEMVGQYKTRAALKKAMKLIES